MGPLEDPVTFRYLLTGKRARGCGIIYLEHGTGTFEAGGRRWTVFGSPSSPGRPGAAFVHPRHDASAAKYETIPEDVEIVLTHTPPRGTLDQIEWQNKKVNAGSPALEDIIAKVRPRLHVFGHLHQSRGATYKTWKESEREDEHINVEDEDSSVAPKKTNRRIGTIFVNAATQASGRGLEEIQRDLGSTKPPELRDGQSWFQPIIVDLEV